MFKSFLLHPENGLMTSAFRQLGPHIEGIKAQWTDFIEEQTKQADDVLYQATKSLIKLRSKTATKEEIKTARELLLKLYKEPVHFGKVLSGPEKDQIVLLASSLWTAYNRGWTPSIQEQVETVLRIISPIVSKQQGQLIQDGNRLLDSFIDHLTERATEPDGALHQVAQQISNTARAELEDASRILNQLIRELDNSSKPVIKKLVPKALENLTLLKEQQKDLFSKEALNKKNTDVINKLIRELSKPVIPHKNELLPIIKQAKALIDREIGLQLGDGAKITRTMVNEVKQGVSDVLDDFESRIQKLARPVYAAFGLNPDDDEGSADYSKVIETAEALQNIRGGANSKEATKKALDELSHLIASPNTIIQRDWTESERGSLLNLQATLRGALTSPPTAVLKEVLQDQIKQVLEETLAPFISTPLNQMIGSLTGVIAQLVTLSATKAGMALSKKIGGQVAYGVRVLMENAKGQLTTTNDRGETTLHHKKYKPIVDAIEQLIPLVNAAEKNGEFSELSNLIQGFHEKIKGLPPIYVNKIPLVFGSKAKSHASNSFSPYADGIAKDKRVLNENQNPNAAPINFRQITDLNKKEFANVATNLIVMKSVYETICGIKPRNSNFYANIFDHARIECHEEPSLLDVKLRKIFFKEINERYKEHQITFIHKQIAKLAHFVMTPFVNILITRFTSRFIDYMREIIIDNNEDGFAQLQNRAMKNSNSYLGALGDAYDNALKNPSVKGSLPKKLKRNWKNLNIIREFPQKIFTKKLLSRDLIGSFRNLS